MWNHWGAYGNIEKLLVLVCFKHLAVLGRALKDLGRSCGKPWGAMGDPSEALERSLGILGVPWRVLGESLGPPDAATLNKYF